MKSLFFVFVFIVLIGFTTLAIITGNAILISWEENHTIPVFILACVVYIISIMAMLSAVIWVIHSSLMEEKFEKESKAIRVQPVPQFAF